MSLWNKPLSGVTYDDLDAFCRLGLPEGMQLDYKQEVTSKLANLVCAYANTRGGLLLLGVDSDKSTNKPVWPSEGMERNVGYSEQITQICRDNIYPPVLPEISQLLDTPAGSDRVFLVVRIAESIQAPHSMRNSNKVYVRTGDVNSPFKLADVERIKVLLDRRANLENHREYLLTRYLTRMKHRLPTGPEKQPWFWWFLSPEFPDEPLCSVDQCASSLGSGVGRSAPDGYLYYRSYSDRNERSMSGCGQYGDLFQARSFNVFKQASRIMPGDFICRETLAFLKRCTSFFQADDTANPGVLRFCVGCEEVRDKRLGHFDDLVDCLPFPDDQWRVDRVINSLDATPEAVAELAFDVMEVVFSGFGLERKPYLVEHWGRS